MKKLSRRISAAIVLVVALSMMSMSVMAATVTVKGDACVVRSEASTTSDAVASVTQGKKLDVVGSTQSADGYTWYQIKDGDKTGYIRADLVEAPDGEVPASSNTSSSTSEQTDSQTTEAQPVAATETTVNTSTALKAVVTGDTVTVRSGASTSTSKAGSAKKDTEVDISGEATDSEGKLWYQVSFTDGDKTVSGFIRSDFLNVTEVYEEQVEEEPVEEPVEEATPEVPKDYECVYAPNADGVEEWYLYDHVRGTKQSINNIYAVMQQAQEGTSDSDSNGFKIATIVLAVLVVLLVIVITILIFKLRDGGYAGGEYEEYDDDYEDDENYDEEYDNNDDVYAEEEDIEDEKPKKKFGRGRKVSSRRQEYSLEDEDDDEYDRPSGRARRNDSWADDDMLDIDDDMEFEFLDLDN